MASPVLRVTVVQHTILTCHTVYSEFVRGCKRIALSTEFSLVLKIFVGPYNTPFILRRRREIRFKTEMIFLSRAKCSYII